MRRKSSLCAFLCACSFFAVTACNNYDLLQKLENPGQSSVGPGPRNLRIFVSNAFNNGNLGGAAGADIICLSDTANPMGADNGSWKALIVGGGRRACSTPYCSGGAAENIDWALKPNTNYVRPNGLVIGNTDPAGLLVFPLNSAISDLTTTFAWTGLAGDWMTGSTCTDWGNGTSGSGDRGGVDKNDPQAINIGIDTCGTSQRLYCVEQ
ncbi:MAG TPA: DUF1554 domain-containing protein [Turneriella sp.]|nr:DUF1554 domain-containing protein [Turneriella sp.]HMY10639.1 DUF1554 domain-containing protein [Turneriella sp.]HNA79226.1 DUF1554 domain-containing protein [Turneriella sp.]HNE20533.1 DUF1554 domain-containing protein [Turneriella sp.]HNL12001.1 DUF1554 domain-containing protein [Turneriella sp.]